MKKTALMTPAQIGWFASFLSMAMAQARDQGLADLGTYMYIYICICIYMYIYICIHIYVHINILSCMSQLDDRSITNPDVLLVRLFPCHPMLVDKVQIHWFITCSPLHRAGFCNAWF